MKTFDLYLASVKWASSDKIGSITLSKCPLEPTQLLEGRYIYDSIIYQKNEEDYLQIVVRSTSPVFLNDNEKLYNIKDSDIWLIKGEWRVSELGKKYHYCPSINTVGDLFLKNETDSIQIRVAPNISDFDFDVLKQDFNGELWDLITSNNSKTKTGASSISFGDKIFRFAESQSVIEFISAFESITLHPKKELKSSITISSAKKVRPIPLTYKKLALNSESKTLPSKNSTPDIDVYENRLLCLMLHKIFQIINYNIKYTSLQINRLKIEKNSIREQIKGLSEEPTVNGLDILNEINTQKKYYQTWLQKWESNKNLILSSCDNSDCRVSMIIEIVYESDNYNYWVKKDGEYSLMSFPVAMNSIFEEQKNQQLRIKAYCYRIGLAGQHPKYEVRAMQSIELIKINYTSIIAKQESNYEKLKNNNWSLYSIINNTEKTKLIKERNNQITTLEKRVEKIIKQISSLSDFSEEVTFLAPLLQKLLNNWFVAEINYKKLVRFQPSMTYIQNPKYRKALKHYNDILSAEGIDIAIFGYYEEIINYSIREMPQVYELWCLVSLIKILEETFSLKAKPSDLKQLIENIQPNVKKIEKHTKISFIGNPGERNIFLHYQKRIKDKRPDFVLEISIGARSINLVLDAKFKNYNYKLSASEEIRLLLDKYKVDSNHFVFSLHPNNDLITDERSTKLTNLGGEHIYSLEGNILLPFHQYGYINVKPLQTDNLKKLIGMAIEYLLESDHNAKQNDRSIDPSPIYEMICLSCGSEDFTITKRTRGTNRFSFTYTCNNPNCQHTIYVDYCWNCKTKLFKHGSYWDYHKTSVWSIFDIHCPCCGMTVADMPYPS